MLRAGRIPAQDKWYRHTHLTEQLYADVLESDLLFQARMHRLVAWAAMHGHPSADLEKAGQSLRMHYIDALGMIPYITGGQTGEDALQAERMQLVQRYHEHRERVLQGRTIRAPRDRQAGITKVGHVDAKR